MMRAKPRESSLVRHSSPTTTFSILTSPPPVEVSVQVHTAIVEALVSGCSLLQSPFSLLTRQFDRRTARRLAALMLHTAHWIGPKTRLSRRQPNELCGTALNSSLLGYRSSFATLSDVPDHSSSPDRLLVGDEDACLPTFAQDLGHPLPDDQHACSVSLPTWSSVVGYEEGEPDVVDNMPCGYPRFVYHPYITQLGECVLEKYSDVSRKEDCLLLPSREAALRCQAFLEQALYPDEDSKKMDVCRIGQHQEMSLTGQDGKKVHVVDLECWTNAHAVLFPATTFAGMEAKAYWQHTGEVMSSRAAEATLKEVFSQETNPLTPHCKFVAQTCNKPSKMDDEHPHKLLKDRIADLASVPSEYVYLTTSGMASLYKSLLAARRVVAEDAASIVFGFPYLDTLKLCSRSEICPGGVEFFGHGDERDLKALRNQMEDRSFCALFTEVPSNPLLQCPDLYELRRLADEHGFCLVVDDTIGNFANVNMLESGLADAVCTSLTKLVSGRGDAMAGSIVCNPNTKLGRSLQQDLQKHMPRSDLHPVDAWAVHQNSQDFLERNAQINDTAERLADFLQGHPDVDRVYYPKYTPMYESFASTRNSYGCLFSVLLDQHICQRTFYDALEVAKGPSLGTNFTLACPYTLLAHYHELDFAMEYNVQPNLLRVSVGLESFECLRDKFELALETSRLYPKIGRRSASPQTVVGQSRPYCTVADRVMPDHAPVRLPTVALSRSTVSSTRIAVRAVMRLALRGRAPAYR